MKIALYPGTFDPISMGHMDLIYRSARLFDKVIVAVAKSQGKSPLFDHLEREDLVRQSTQAIGNVEVCSFSGLLVDLYREKQAVAMIRGVRTVGDYDFEHQLARMNKKLNTSVETLFLTPDETLACISSTLLREIAKLGGDISPYVPQPVNQALKQKLAFSTDK